MFRPISIEINGKRFDCLPGGTSRGSVPDGLISDGRLPLLMDRLYLLAKGGPFRGRSVGPLGNRMDVLLHVLRSHDRKQILDVTVVISNFAIPCHEAAWIPEQYLLRSTATIYPAAIESLTISEATESGFRRATD
jgi:hypothetical protein